MPESDRPFVTFALFIYNQENFVAEAIEAALRQEYSPLEIIISDDCSNDRSFEIAQNIVRRYRGPHIVKLNRNERNLGLIGHVNLMFGMAGGKLIIAAGGDDISFPHRVSRLVHVFQESGCSIIHSAVERIDARGRALGPWVPPLIDDKIDLQRAAGALALYIGASGAWSRDLYDRYGPITYANTYEDLVFGFRALIDESIAYVEEPLLKYRVGAGISTAKLSASHLKSIHSNRLAEIRVASAVMRQRLRDLALASHRQDILRLRQLVGSAYFRQRLRFALYARPASVLAALFGRRGLMVCAVINEEFRYFAGSFRTLCLRGVGRALTNLRAKLTAARSTRTRS